MNNIRLRIPTLAQFLPTEAVAFLDSEITMSVLTGEFTVDLTGCHYNNDMFSDSDTGNYYFPKTVQSPVMSLSKWFSYWAGYFTYAFPHNFTIKNRPYLRLNCKVSNYRLYTASTLVFDDFKITVKPV